MLATTRANAMSEIGQDTEILEDYEPLLELKAAHDSGNRLMFDRVLHQLSEELANECRVRIDEKVRRWATATVVLRFFDRPPARTYIQAKMLYRDGFYEATIMVCRSIAEMVCYDRLECMSHPFGATQDVERKNFRDLLKWLLRNDCRITTKVFDNLNSLYDLGNNYVHPKAAQCPKDDSIRALHLIGEAVFEVYGVKSPSEMMTGRTIRTAYSDFPDICGGTNFWLTGFIPPRNADKRG
jgi:hypothetical protein